MIHDEDLITNSIHFYNRYLLPCTGAEAVGYRGEPTSDGRARSGVVHHVGYGAR